MLKRLAIPGAYLLVVVSFALSAYYGNREVRETDNRTRCSVVGLVDQLTTNSERNVRATLAAPTATADQKATAEANLRALLYMRATTANALHHPHGKACP